MTDDSIRPGSDELVVFHDRLLEGEISAQRVVAELPESSAADYQQESEGEGGVDS